MVGGGRVGVGTRYERKVQDSHTKYDSSPFRQYRSGLCVIPASRVFYNLQVAKKNGGELVSS